MLLRPHEWSRVSRLVKQDKEASRLQQNFKSLARQRIISSEFASRLWCFQRRFASCFWGFSQGKTFIALEFTPQEAAAHLMVLCSFFLTPSAHKIPNPKLITFTLSQNTYAYHLTPIAYRLVPIAYRLISISDFVSRIFVSLNSKLIFVARFFRKHKAETCHAAQSAGSLSVFRC